MQMKKLKKEKIESMNNHIGDGRKESFERDRLVNRSWEHSDAFRRYAGGNDGISRIFANKCCG